MNNRLKLKVVVLMLICSNILACTSQTTRAASCPNDISEGALLGVETVPDSASSDYQSAFCKYTKIVAPNGHPIEIFAQAQVSNDQMIRARRILEFYLENVPGSIYGADKSSVANQMAINQAKLLLLNGRDDGSNPVMLDGQPLYEEEMTVEGSTAYMNNDFENHRDASFEEILHLMHDTGIGVDGPNSQPGVLSAYQTEIRAATNNAMANNFPIWPLQANTDPDIQDWYNELSQENSLTQEYLAAVVDVYYGLWAPWDEHPQHGMHGLYAAKVRSEIMTEDPSGYALMGCYFNPYLTYMARIDNQFQGTFSLTLDKATPYTHKSQYLLNARLTGSNAANLTGNGQNNKLQGNAADNVLDGRRGTDTAIFVGNRQDYAISLAGSQVTVTDTVANRDGSDTLEAIEWLQFADQTISVSSMSMPTSFIYLPLM